MTAPDTVYQLEALARADGSVLAIANLGSSLASTRVLPGLSVRLTTTARRLGKHWVLTRWAQALDNGFGVPGATFTAGGRSVRADASGKAQLTALPHHTTGTVSAAGYTSAAFRVP